MKDIFQLSPLLGLALALVFGLLMTRVVRLFGIPNVSGFLMAGILVGPSVLNLLHGNWLSQISVIIDVALGFIAFSIGGEFKISVIKKLGKRVTVITFVQALMAVVMVIIALLIVHYIKPSLISIPEVILLGAIATATAPAATLLVVRQYKARGPVTETLLPVVAFDDAIGLIFFAICFGIAKVLQSGAAINVNSVFVHPLIEIFASISVGLVLGALLSFVCKFFKSRANRLSWMVATIIGAVALSQALHLSSLLICMTIGITFANFRKDALNILEQSERWTAPLYVLFFVISGATLDLKVVPYIGVVGIIYILARSVGKYTGAALGGLMTKADKPVTKYLGLALLPQAGVAIGMAQIVAVDPSFASIAKSITTVVLCATLVYEIFGPLITKFALAKSGELTASAKLPIVDMFQHYKEKRKRAKQ